MRPRARSPARLRDRFGSIRRRTVAEQRGAGLAGDVAGAGGGVVFVVLHGEVGHRGERGGALVDGHCLGADLGGTIQARDEVEEGGMLEDVQELRDGAPDGLGDGGEGLDAVEVEGDDHIELFVGEGERLCRGG